MSTTIAKFVDRCYDIVLARPEYKLGCSDKKQCDCIGMVKYGLRQNGVNLGTTGTNWTFRNQVQNIRQITSADVLKKGDVVFKVKKPGVSGYGLPSKYQKGGSAYNGDLNDYTHIGVVKRVNPLQIIHMTSPTAKTDTGIGKWAYAAELKPEYISGSGTAQTQAPAQESKQDPEPAPVLLTATVCSDNGKPVKLRARPTTSCALYDLVQVNTMVIVNSYKKDWCQVTCGKRKGWYMMTKFLAFS